MIEVNSNPMIKTLEDHGRWDLIDDDLAREFRRVAEMKIWRVPYPKFGNGVGLERVSRIAAVLASIWRCSVRTAP